MPYGIHQNVSFHVTTACILSRFSPVIILLLLVVSGLSAPRGPLCLLAQPLLLKSNLSPLLPAH